MKFLDRVCAGALFVLGIAQCLLISKTYTGRLWIFGTGLAILFTAMLNLLRTRNGYGVRGLRVFCLGANVIMLVFTIAMMASIGESRSLHNPQVPFLAVLLLVETLFSLGKNP
jgi:hypothetical protein